MTPLDVAVEEMERAPEDDTKRLAFFERLAASELFLLLENEPVGDTIDPRLFETSAGTFALAFDTEERLTGFAGGPAAYAALSGRSLAEMFADAEIGLGLNLDVAPSSQLLPAGAVKWLSDTLSARPSEDTATPESFSAPGSLPEKLILSLDTRLAQATGLAHSAFLAEATYSNGRRGHILAVIDAIPGAEAAIARTLQDALTFSGLDAGELDVTFLKASDPAAARLAKVGLRFDLPEREKSAAPSAPGMDPDKPPKLT